MGGKAVKVLGKILHHVTALSLTVHQHIQPQALLEEFNDLPDLLAETIRELTVGEGILPVLRPKLHTNTVPLRTIRRRLQAVSKPPRNLQTPLPRALSTKEPYDSAAKNTWVIAKSAPTSISSFNNMSPPLRHRPVMWQP